MTDTPIVYNPALLQRTIANGATLDEIDLFIAQCHRTGLDPYSRQINLMIRRSKDRDGNWTQKASIMISIDGARLVAARTGLYNGSTSLWCGDDGVWLDVWLAEKPPAAAKVSVMRGTGVFTGIALWREYGAPAQGPIWRSMPALMLCKCAEMMALRRGFPAELSGLYSTDEMAQASPQEPQLHSEAEAQPEPATTSRPPTTEVINTLDDFLTAMQSRYPEQITSKADLIAALKTAGVKGWPRKVTPAIIQNLTDQISDVVNSHTTGVPA